MRRGCEARRDLLLFSEPSTSSVTWAGGGGPAGPGAGQGRRRGHVCASRAREQGEQGSGAAGARGGGNRAGRDGGAGGPGGVAARWRQGWRWAAWQTIAMKVGDTAGRRRGRRRDPTPDRAREARDATKSEQRGGGGA